MVRRRIGRLLCRPRPQRPGAVKWAKAQQRPALTQEPWAFAHPAVCRKAANCMKPQIAIRAETTRAAHDTFIDTLYGPICTVHQLISLTTCPTALEQKSGPKLLHKTSTSYSLPRFSLSAPVRALTECRPRTRHDGDEGKAVRRGGSPPNWWPFLS
jgi:hypothetical protein